MARLSEIDGQSGGAGIPEFLSTSFVALALTPDFKTRRTSSRAMSGMGHFSPFNRSAGHDRS